MPRHAPTILVLASIPLVAACDGGSESDVPADEPIAAAPAAAEAAPPTSAIAYDCEPAQRLTASYDNSGATPKATLSLEGTIYELFEVTSASGAKYATDEGRTPGKTLVWFTKGDDGTLYEGTVGGTEVEETKLADCSPADAAG
jgi:membrane-bound inhibitor of C-type lysozyme